MPWCTMNIAPVRHVTDEWHRFCWVVWSTSTGQRLKSVLQKFRPLNTSCENPIKRHLVRIEIIVRQVVGKLVVWTYMYGGRIDIVPPNQENYVANRSINCVWPRLVNNATQRTADEWIGRHGISRIEQTDRKLDGKDHTIEPAVVLLDSRASLFLTSSEWALWWSRRNPLKCANSASYNEAPPSPRCGMQGSNYGSAIINCFVGRCEFAFYQKVQTVFA